MGEDIRKIFVSGISTNTNEDSLKGYFQNYGEVLNVIIIKDLTTGIPREFGFVLFDDPAVAARVIMERKHTIDGNVVQAKKVVRHDDPDVLKKRIFVGGLQSTVTEADLRSYFNQFGTVLDVEIILDKISLRRRGFAFIGYDSEDAVHRALVRRFHWINSKKVDVKRAFLNGQYDQRTSEINTRRLGRSSIWSSDMRTNGRPGKWTVPGGCSLFPSDGFGSRLNIEAGLNPNPNYLSSLNHSNSFSYPFYNENAGRYNSSISYGYASDNAGSISNSNAWNLNLDYSNSYINSRSEGLQSFRNNNGMNWNATYTSKSSMGGGNGSVHGSGNHGFGIGENNYPLRDSSYGRGNASSSHDLSSAPSQPEGYSLFHYGFGNIDFQTATGTTSGDTGRRDAFGGSHPP